MAALSPKRVPHSAAIVFSFWGFIFWVYNADKATDPTLALSVSIACLVAGILAKSESIAYRKNTKSGLLKDTVRGVVSSIGPVPFHTPVIPINNALDTKLIRANYPPEFRDSKNDLVAQYFSKYEVSHPHYADLFEAILRLLTAPEHIYMPASYACDGTNGDLWIETNYHGNRSLLTHSILVYDLMISESESYCEKYSPEKPKHANDINFKPDSNDPLIGILGLAHDIGKLKTFILLENNGKYLAKKIKRNHDSEGSRVMSLLPEFWNPNIPPIDRAIIQNVMAFYHHPSDLPIAPPDENSAQEKYVSDRQTALLWLLVKSDRMAGAIEHGESYDRARRTVIDLKIDTDLSSNSHETILESFIRFLATTHGVNAKGGRSTAFKTSVDDKTLLIFDEKEFINNYADFIGKPEFKTMKTSGNSPHPVISNLLKTLDTQSVVYRVESNSTAGMPAELCLYSIEFFDPNDDGIKPSLILSSAFILDISGYDVLARYKNMPDSHSKPKFGRRRFGARGVDRKSTDDNIVSELFSGSDAEESFGFSIMDLPKRKQGKQKIAIAGTAKIKPSALAVKLISQAIQTSALVPIKEFKKDNLKMLVFAGADEWFIKNIGPIESMRDPAFMSACNITEIKPSVKSPDQHIIVVAIG